MIFFCVCVLLLPVSFSHPLSGWVSSPGYPERYKAHTHMMWQRCAPAGYTLTLSIFHLDMEDSNQCENDTLKVFAGSVLLETLCGRMSVEQLQSSINPSLRSTPGGCLFLTFQANFSNTEGHTGFRAFYTVQDVDECWDSHQCSHFCHNYIGGYSCSCKPGSFLSDDEHTCAVNCMEERFGEGILTPPGSPGPYFENVNCSYTLSVEEGKQIVLSFIGEFDVESRDDHCVDSLTIKTDSATFGPFCGNKVPAAINTTAQYVQVFFLTDQGGTNKGFTLNYKTKVMECLGFVTANSMLFPERSLYSMGETVNVSCVTGYTLEVFDAKTFNSVCQKSGKWSPVYPCELVDCGNPELPDSELMSLKDESQLNTTYKTNISVKCRLESYYQLFGEENFTCSADGYWKSKTQILSKDAKLPKCLPVCGMNEDDFYAARVFGGEKAALGQIPWQLLIKTPRHGGASLISDRWALTAAHVVDGYETKKLIFYGGMVDKEDKNVVKMETETIIIHPDYEKSPPKRSSYDNDIALVKMSKRVPLSTNILPICLPKNTTGPVMENKMGTVSGFGITANYSLSQFLQYGNLKEYSELPCFESTLNVTDNMFCAGNQDQHVDSCKGDSGGPLVIPMIGYGSRDMPYQLKGIVSWGPRRCGKQVFKGYYTKVQNYLDWIRETMEIN